MHKLIISFQIIVADKMHLTFDIHNYSCAKQILRVSSVMYSRADKKQRVTQTAAALSYSRNFCYHISVIGPSVWTVPMTFFFWILRPLANNFTLKQSNHHLKNSKYNLHKSLKN